MFRFFRQATRESPESSPARGEYTLSSPETNEDVCYFDEVPNEIKQFIFSFLICDDLIRASLVCKKFHTIINNSLLVTPKFSHIPCQGTIPPPRVCHAAITIGDSLIIHGGHVPSPPNFYITNVKDDMYEYNFVTKTWTEIKGDSLSRTEHSFFKYGDHVYTFGGYGPGRYTNELSRYDHSKRQFIPVTVSGSTLPHGRSACSCSVYKNKLYIYGGWSGSKSLQDFYVFNFETSSWEEKKANIPALRSHGSVVYKDSLYLFGGYGEDEGHPSTLFRYNLETEEWSTIQTRGNVPCGRSRSKFVVFENKLLLIGGWDRQQYFDDMYELSFDRMTWKKVVTLDSPIGQHALVLHDQTLYQFGGFNGANPVNILQQCKLRN